MNCDNTPLAVWRTGWRAVLGTAAGLALVACGGGDDAAPGDAPAQAGSSAEAVGALASGRVSALAGPVAGALQLVSTTTSGGAATAGSTTCGVSADGQLVLFSSSAANLVAGDSNGAADLFLKNLISGATTRVTTQSSGAQLAAGGNCLGANMTPDGRRVAFNANAAVFVKDTQTGVLTQVSPPAGTVRQVAGYFGGVLSDDGNKVVFMTRPEQTYVGAYRWVNVVPARLMLRDLSNGSLVTLNTDNGKVAQGEVSHNRFSISPDGSQVAFISSSTSLVPGDTNGLPDVFVRNLANSTTQLASSSSAGASVAGTFFLQPVFVSNTRVAFNSGQASASGAAGLYVKNLATGALELALSSAEGDGAVLSGDARTVAFTRVYSGWDRRVFVRDRSSGVEVLASASSEGVPSNGNATGPTLSRDGTRVAFGSAATNLLATPVPAGVAQVYAKQVAAPSALQ